jgi:hypothetical protein
MTGHGLIPVELQVVSVVVLALLLAWVLRLVRQQRLSLRDSLVWVVSTLLAGAVALFPGLLVWASSLLGFQVPSNALFGAAVLYLAVNVLVNTVASSQTAARLRRVTQECALLRAELESLRGGSGVRAGSATSLLPEAGAPGSVAAGAAGPAGGAGAAPMGAGSRATSPGSAAGAGGGSQRP